MTTVASFAIQFLDPQGEPTQPLPQFAREPALLIALYRAMVLARAFDAKAIAMQRTGKSGSLRLRSARKRWESASRVRCGPKTFRRLRIATTPRSFFAV